MYLQYFSWARKRGASLCLCSGDRSRTFELQQFNIPSNGFYRISSFFLGGGEGSDILINLFKANAEGEEKSLLEQDHQHMI